MRRRSRVMRTDRITTAWMLAALGAAVITLFAASSVPQPLWTLVHLITLGVLSNAVFQWSWYFVRALAHLGPEDPRAGRRNTWRIIAFNTAFLILIASMWNSWLLGTHVGATLIGVIGAWHGYDLVRAAESKLASRFIVVLRFYQCSACFLILTASFAGLVTAGMFAADAPGWLTGAHDGLVLAHAIAGLGGWLGLTIGGTLVTLGPTVLRTRMDAHAVSAALHALPLWTCALLLSILSASFSFPFGIGLGLLLVDGAALVGIALPLARAARSTAVREYAAWSLLAGVFWILLSLAVIATNALRTQTPTELRSQDLHWLTLIGIGGIAQLFIGALASLMPVVIGGGPAAVRLGIAASQWLAPARLAARNSALLLLSLLALAPTDIPGALTGIRLFLALTFAVDIVLLARSGIIQSRAAKARSASRPVPPPSSSPSLTLNAHVPARKENRHD